MLELFRSNKLIIAVLAAVLVGGAAVAYWVWTRNRVSTDDAYVSGHIFIITPRVSGYVTNVLVDDNQKVKKGQPLLMLDPTDYQVAADQSEANLADNRFLLASTQLGVPLTLTQTHEQVRAAQAELNSLEQTLAQLLKEEDAAAQNVKQLQAQYQLARLDLKRDIALRQTGAVAQQTLDTQETTVRSVKAQLDAAKARLESVRKQKSAQDAQIDQREANIKLAATGKQQAEIKERETEAQKAKVKLAEAQLQQARLNLSYTTITAPVDGYVTNKNIEAGQFVSPGQKLLAVVSLMPPNVWIVANYKETDLTYVRPGQRVTIEVDTYPGRVVHGTVDSIMAGSGAVFSLFPPENATGNFVKVVQRIPVKIVIDKKDWASMPVLRLGMSVVPTIYTGN
jgi:membrane fusion protein (multidrug efflux system)